MKKLIGNVSGKKVLDAGCGFGFYSIYCAKQGASVTAVDISRRMIERLASRLKSPKLKLVQANITRPMPFFDTESFDCIICSLVLHYIKDWELLLAELYRVMKKDGKMVISPHHPMNMYLYLKTESYVDFKLVEDTWGERGSRPFKVHYYIRPLNEVLRPIIKSQFNIINIDEPLPDEKCKEQ